MKWLFVGLFFGLLLPAQVQPPAEPKPLAAVAPFDAAAVAPSSLPVVFYHDFRGKPLPNEVTLAVPNAVALCEVQPEGLRITISKKATTHPKGGVGIHANIGLRGDFEATATLEILNAETPNDGYGVGASIYAATQTKTGDASLARLVAAGGRQFLANWWRGIKQQESAPCTDTTLRLRLRRVGNVMYFLWSPGLNNNDFQVSGKIATNPKDVEFIRVSAHTDQKPCDVDVRWLNLQIRGHKSTEPVDPAKSWSNTPSPASAAAAKSAAGKGGIAIIVLVIGLIVTLIACVGCWLYLRKRSS